MEKVILFGNGQNAAMAYFHLLHDSSYEVSAFTVDRTFLEDDTFCDLPVVPFEEIQSAYPPEAYKMLISVSFRGVNRLRAEKYHQAKEKGYELIRLISSRATTWPGQVIGDNVVIGANATLGAYVEIGSNVTIAAGCVIGHHTVIRDHCFLAAGCVISGSVTVEPYSFIGSGAVVRDRLTIARESVIGAGALILEDTVERGVYLGRMADRLPVTSDQLPLG